MRIAIQNQPKLSEILSKWVEAANTDSLSVSEDGVITIAETESDILDITLAYLNAELASQGEDAYVSIADYVVDTETASSTETCDYVFNVTSNTPSDSDIEMAASINEDDIEDEDDYSEEDDSLDEDEDEDEAQPKASAPKLKDGKPVLRVLVDAEMHKLAGKIYNMVNSSGNMASFMSFLNDFDALLDEYSSSSEEGAKPKAVEDASALEVATTFLGLAFETAKAKKKKKEGRAGLLSALMKSISGDAGEKVVNAWDANNTDKLEELFGEVVKKLKKHMENASPVKEVAEEVVEDEDEPEDNTSGE